MTTTLPAAPTAAPDTFAALGVDADLTAALDARGITDPFPVQHATIPLCLAGADVIGQGRTGTGKTLAFGLPLIQRLTTAARPRRPEALVVAPTRELAAQVSAEVALAGSARGVRVVACYGGVALDGQRRALAAGVDVVVGTPGRLLDLSGSGHLDLSAVTAVVLDEADEMLDLGFLPDVERLLDACPAAGRQTLLFSATLPASVVTMARRYMSSPTFVHADSTADAHTAVTAADTTQHFFQTHPMDKPRVAARILQTPTLDRALVFCATKRMVDRLVDELAGMGVDAVAIHGGLPQAVRERSLAAFRAGRSTVLVATEVAARGIDVEEVTHVLNYDCPADDRAYLHRIGRTGRAGRAGVAVTFASAAEVTKLRTICRRVGAGDAEILEVYSPQPILTEVFDLPAAPARGAEKAAARPAARKPAGATGAARRPAAEKPAGATGAARRPAAEKPAGRKPAGRKPADRKPAAVNPRLAPSPIPRRPAATPDDAPRRTRTRHRRR